MKLLKIFIWWRLLLFVFLFLAISILPLQFNFIGGGLDNYLHTPQLWAWSNFDGEHYLSIVERGYQSLTYFYFPLYPLLTRFLATSIDKSITNLAVSGLLISNTVFLIGLLGLIRLMRLDYEKKIVSLSVILLLLFPTSFYFASFYTESLFLALVVWSFYFARKKRWFLAGILGAFSTATRITGLALVPAFILEFLIQRRKENEDSFAPLFAVNLIPLGLITYMFYLNQRTADPFAFVHNLAIFGEQRSEALILLPQVFYRYFVKVLPSLNYNYFPVVYTSYFEVFTATAFLILLLVSITRLRASYTLFFFVTYMVPTLTGSFSSLPRYVLVIFPAFIMMGILLNRFSRIVRLLIFTTLFILLGITTALFVRGYWIS